MVRIEGDSVIGRPVEMVFDFVADQQNEPAYDPRMQRAEKTIDGPAGKGTPFVSAAGSLRRTFEPVAARLPRCMAAASGFQPKAATADSSPTSAGSWLISAAARTVSAVGCASSGARSNLTPRKTLRPCTPGQATDLAALAQMAMFWRYGRQAAERRNDEQARRAAA